jgi:hypothetical protein
MIREDNPYFGYHSEGFLPQESTYTDSNTILTNRNDCASKAAVSWDGTSFDNFRQRAGSTFGYMNFEDDLFRSA